MKWSHKRGDVRILKKFAFLPITLDNSDTIWLEKYKIKQQLKTGIGYNCFFGEYNFVEWETFEKCQ